MNDLNREIYLVQNPAIGAVILWRFVCGYYENDGKCRQVPFPLLFLVLPIIFRQDLREVIQGTYISSGLQKVSEKLFKNNKADLFCSIHYAADQYKATTLSAISIATKANLIGISIKDATVLPLHSKVATMQSSSESLLKQAAKLGTWCSQLTLYEISVLLKVRF